MKFLLLITLIWSQYSNAVTRIGNGSRSYDVDVRFSAFDFENLPNTRLDVESFVQFGNTEPDSPRVSYSSAPTEYFGGGDLEKNLESLHVPYAGKQLVLNDRPLLCFEKDKETVCYSLPLPDSRMVGIFSIQNEDATVLYQWIERGLK